MSKLYRVACEPSILAGLFVLPLLVFVAFPTTVFSQMDDPKPGQEREFEVAKGVKMLFCWVPSGESQLGSTVEERHAVLETKWGKAVEKAIATEDEKVRRKFKTSGFWLGKDAVTQSQYEAVVGKNPSDDKKEGDVKGKYPVTNVSWLDCQSFIEKCEKKNFRVKLPHEDEWEHACRGGKGNRLAFYWGNGFDEDSNREGTYAFGAEKDLLGKYARTAKHPWGFVGLNGNVCQWCDNTYAPDSKLRVLKGGSSHLNPILCRSAFRNGEEADVRKPDYGFRLKLVSGPKD